MDKNTILNLIGKLMHAYYDLRDIDGIIECVSDNIFWIGTELMDTASGKDELRKLLQKDIEDFPDSFAIQLDNTVVNITGENTATVCAIGHQVEIPGVVCGFTVRGTVNCVRTNEGWLVDCIHISVPNSQIEKYTLQKELDENRRTEKLIMGTIPGGVAIYRLKSNGNVETDYVSESLAKMCGYEAKEFHDYLRRDSKINIVEEDIDNVMSTAMEAISNNKPISVLYRIYTKNKDKILIRLDAKAIVSEDMREDDIALLYAVHTIVSDEAKKIISRNDEMYQLINQVPGGLGIFEIKNGRLFLNYINDAYYKMMNVNRNMREEFLGDAVINMVHPDDIMLVKEAINKLLKGDNEANIVFRAYESKEKFNWISLNALVVERYGDYIKFFANLSLFNNVIKAQQDLESSHILLENALQMTKTVTWKYNYLLDTVTDAGTLQDEIKIPKVVDKAKQWFVDYGLVHEDSKDEYDNLYAKLSIDQIAFADIKSKSVGDHGNIWHRVIYMPRFDPFGKYIESIGVAIDITEQKIREQNYKDQLQLSQIATKDALSKITFNLSKNTITKIETNHESFESHNKYKTLNDLLRSVNEYIKDEKEIRKFDIVADVDTIKKSYFKGTSHFEVIGHLQANTKWIKVNYDLIENPYTNDIEGISFIEDVTETVRAEMVVKQLLDVDYQSILLIDTVSGKASPYSVDKVDEFLDKVMILQQNEGSGQHGLEKFLRKYAVPGTSDKIIKENSLDFIKEKLEKEPYYECMYSLIMNGNLAHFRVLYCYLNNDENVLLSAVQDVTEMYEGQQKQKKELETALVRAKAANEAKTAFLSRVSHDMRTPLNGILGLTTILKDSISDENLTKDLNELELSGNYLLELINDTLDVSRIESGKLELKPVVCQGKTLFNNSLSLAKTSMKSKNIKFTVSAENIPFTYLYVDIGRIEQVVMNVLGNAVKFTPEGGCIDVILENIGVDDETITDKLTIKDNGIGMSKDFIPHIFEKFTQEDTTRTSTYQGTGLGMAITSQILHLMGGDISVESELGEGSKFIIILKMKKATSKQIKQWKKSTSSFISKGNLSGKRVLLCEDHPLNIKIATKLLEKKKLIVEHAANGKIAVEKFAASKVNYYDAILMDIRMPIMDGIDATKAIRNLKREDSCEIPIIAMTANAFYDDVEQSKSAGMNAHLSKPIKVDVLYKTLEDLIK